MKKFIAEVFFGALAVAALIGSFLLAWGNKSEVLWGGLLLITLVCYLMLYTWVKNMPEDAWYVLFAMKEKSRPVPVLFIIPMATMLCCIGLYFLPRLTLVLILVILMGLVINLFDKKTMDEANVRLP